MTSDTDSLTTPAAAPRAVAVGRALVITASNRAAAGVYPDRAGPVLVEGLRALGFEVAEPLVVPDGEPVAVALRDAVQNRYDVVLTTGGTGLSPTDLTPEVTRGVLEREIPGLAEAIRFRGLSGGVPTAALSRGLAGLAGGTLIVNLPGSPGGCRDALAVLDSLLVHAVDQIRGGDHPIRGDHDVRGGDHLIRGDHAVRGGEHDRRGGDHVGVVPPVAGTDTAGAHRG